MHDQGDDWLIGWPGVPSQTGKDQNLSTVHTTPGASPESLVAGHYLPLADNPGVAPEPDQTCSLQSDQRTLQSRVGFALFSAARATRGWGRA